MGMGKNSNGQFMGDGTTTMSRSSPTQIPGTDWVKLYYPKVVLSFASLLRKTY